ncbi:hypothetical protein XENOCAPTIV_015196, partial [Xenoophorus captivus]
ELDNWLCMYNGFLPGTVCKSQNAGSSLGVIPYLSGCPSNLYYDSNCQKNSHLPGWYKILFLGNKAVVSSISVIIASFVVYCSYFLCPKKINNTHLKKTLKRLTMFIKVRR